MGAFVGTINKIEEVGLDRLVFAYVKNFKSLVPRGSVEIDDAVVFIEPDSVLQPAELDAVRPAEIGPCCDHHAIRVGTGRRRGQDLVRPGLSHPLLACGIG